MEIFGSGGGSGKVARSLLRDSWPLILSGVLVSIYVNIDQVMIKHMIDEQAVGLYAIATRLSTAWYFIPIAITSSMFPAILNAKYNNSSYLSPKITDFI